MNQSILVKYEIIKVDDKGMQKSYAFTHPYGAPADDAFAALQEVKETIEARVAELQMAQAAQQQPVEDSEGSSYGN